MNRRLPWAGVAASTACILVATLYASGTDLPPGWSFDLSSGDSAVAVLVWLITGLVLRPIYPPPPYRDFWTPDYTYWGHYRGKVLSARLDGVPLSQTVIDSGSDPGRKPGEPGSRPGADYLLRSGQPLEVTVIAQNRPPGEASPLVALHDHNMRVLLLSVDGTDVTE